MNLMDLKEFSSEFIDSFEFAKFAHQKAFVLTDKEYFDLSGSVKPLMEEILPIALLAQHLRTPELQVDVLWFNDSEPRDGKLRLKGKPVELGFYESEYFLEVTTAVSPKDYLQREALLKNGSVHGGDNIKRQGKSRSPIISKPEVRDSNASVDRAIQWIIDCVRSKASKTYPIPCMLIVNVKPEKVLSVLDWADVFKSVHKAEIESNFKRIYAIDAYHNAVIALPLYSNSLGQQT